jgi:ADP-heptose:LPS heptosyltransferase
LAQASQTLFDVAFNVMERLVSKVLFVRVDRIGDLILTLPCEIRWKKYRPESEVVWLASDAVTWVLKHHLISERVLSVSLFGSPLVKIFSLARALKKEQFSEAVVFFAPWWVGLAVWLARIPKVTGPASKWYSWIFFSNPIRQRRSLALKHEALYNLDLVHSALEIDKSEAEAEPAVLKPLSEKVKQWRRRLCPIDSKNKKIIVLHPGMGGSATNWPAHRYFDLAKELVQSGHHLVITGSESDSDFVRQTQISDLPGVTSLVTQTTPEDLLAVISLADLVIAPSTGVIHLASSLEVPCIGIFSPVKVQAPTRWAPIGAKAVTLVPEVTCPAALDCLNKRCRHHDCMEQINAALVLSKLDQMIGLK